MSSPLQNLQGLSRQSGIPGLGSEPSASDAARAGESRAAFSSVMTQYRGAQAKQTPTQGRAPGASMADQNAARARAADRLSQNQLTSQRQATAQRDAAKPKAAPTEGAKPPAKPAQAEQQNSKAKVSDSQQSDAEPRTAAAEAESDQRDALPATEQAQASGEVRELQPPEDLNTADPAMMLAWLAGLSASEAAPPHELAGGKGLGGGTRDEALATGVHDGRAAGTPAWSAASDQGSGSASDRSGQDASAGALSLEELGLTAVEDERSASSPLEFNAMMARELARPQGVMAPALQGAARHQTATLPTPVQSPEFPQAVAERVGLWVSNAAANGPMTAELRLNPAEMGPVQIRIVLDGQAAQVNFAAANAETRQALEASLPALSAALDEAGLSLSGGGVSDQSAGQSWRGESSGERAPLWGNRSDGARGDGTPELDAQPAGRPAQALSRAGGLDLYA